MNFLVFRRIAHALEKIADAQSDLARVAVDDWQRRHVRPRPSKVEFGMMDLSEVEKLHAAQEEREVLGEEETEEKVGEESE